MINKGTKMINKGAMFGLDARIALAIFGALSVISGAALYSAIQNAKVVQLVTILNEMGKAYEAYLIDTGQNLTVVNISTSGVMNIEEIISNNIFGWKGPYLSFLDNNNMSDKLLISPIYNGFAQYQQLEDEATTCWDGTCHPGCVNQGNTCFIWARLMISDIDVSTIKAADLYVDGVDGQHIGNFRYDYSSSEKSSGKVIFLKVLPSPYQVK